MKASEQCACFDCTGLMFAACVAQTERGERKEKNVHLQAKVVVKASLKVTGEEEEREVKDQLITHYCVVGRG